MLSCGDETGTHVEWVRRAMLTPLFLSSRHCLLQTVWLSHGRQMSLPACLLVKRFAEEILYQLAMPPPRQRVAILLQGKAKADDGRATRRDAVTRSIYLYTRLCGTLPFLLSDALTWCACVRAKPSWRILSGSLELAIPAALILFVIAFRRSFKLNDALFARSSAHACRDDPWCTLPQSSAVSFQRVQWHSLGVRATSPRHGFQFNACTLAWPRAVTARRARGFGYCCCLHYYYLHVMMP